METSKTKICTNQKCNKEKPLYEFNKRKSRKIGYSSECKSCFRNRVKKYSKTKDGLITKIYRNQISHSKARKHNPPTYTKQELKEWLFSQDLFHKLFDEWIISKYQKGLVPSVDRKKDSIGYSIDNIQLTVWHKNKSKGHDDMRSGKLKHGHNPQKKVCQFSIDGIFIKEYISLSEASRKTKASTGGISGCCKGQRKTANGFKWKYLNG